MALTKDGYKIPTASEIRELFTKKMQDKSSAFRQETADVQNALLDCAEVVLLEFHNIANELINSVSLSNANDFMFLQMAQTLGLKQRGQSKAQVMLEFSGNYGDYIPQGCKVGVFETTQATIIPTTKKVRVLAEGDTEEIYQANTLTTIDTNLNNDNISVTNPSASYATSEAETYAEFKQRAQTILRNARVGSFEYVKSCLLSLSGIQSRLINSRITSAKDSENNTWQGVEFVIGGGEPSEIANVLFNNYIETQKLLSNPSDNETSRTQTIPINYNGNALSVSYTLPKLINFGLKINIAFKSLSISSNNVDIVCNEILTNFINSMQVGEPLNKLTIENLIVNALADYNVSPSEISVLEITPQTSEDGIEFIDDEWDLNGYFAKLEFDCYLILKNLVISIGG